jgi:hypothetical protein
MPVPAGFVIKSSQKGMTGLLKMEAGSGQTLENSVLLLVNWRLPFVLTLAPVKGTP